ncbi:Ribonuclease P 40kDa (Rpp40) subunit [Teratosphaeria destructans]|uniref:Ribonuclease P 40kDa (Rpp40) subunit n=1 Tax=Teratosphaeria destructans TaxID=418781 RepID=A0A9W7W634_9PEZI|nr:Ribonuclease P 40kDa (Rpp40) subunit [Teratosphaeria destructans]
MLDITHGAGPKPKCYFTQADLPTFVNHEQPSIKKPPFSVASRQACSHTLDVVLSDAAAARFEQAMNGGSGTLKYASVYIKLGDIIERNFLNHYVKTGNVLMLSEGRAGVDNVFQLNEGILRLEVDKVTYERMGLPGNPIPSAGRKHVRARFAVELNLRLPSMLHGHKGFERVVWAFKNVLNQSMTWLFYDLDPNTEGTAPIESFQPKWHHVEPAVNGLKNALVPAFPNHVLEQDDHESATELLEWISLTFADSPRVQQEDQVDPYLSRYRVPGPSVTDGETASTAVEHLRRFHWHGFLPASFAHRIILAAMKASGKGWFAISASSFGVEAYTILKTDDRTLIWEYMD